MFRNIINGQAVGASARLPFSAPRTGLQIGTAPDSDATAVDLAFQAAQQALEGYKRTTLGECQTLLQLASRPTPA